MKQFWFYIRHALRNISRGGRWTTLAIFCIAAGVATVVALRSLGLAIGDSLVDNVRAENKGDLLLSRGGRGPSGAFSFGFTFESDPNGFRDAEIQRVGEWTEARGGLATAFIVGSNVQVTPQDALTTLGRPQFLSSFFIDPSVYPPTGEIQAIDPAGVPLSQLLTGGNQIVVSENFAESQDLQVGDQVRVSGSDQPYTISGIVPTTAESGLRNIFASFFGFVYFDIQQAPQLIDPGVTPHQLAIAFPEPLNEETLARAERELRPLAGYARVTTYLEVLERNEQIAVVIGDFVVVMGLGALLIGGVGIMNTMLVMVRRRTNEIAALKTFGLKGRQVATLFLVEGAFLGFAGSVVGCIAGILLSGVVNQYGETFLQQPLRWRIYPEALIYGFALGMIITIVFGIAPILTALKVRPGIILRPNETHIPTMGALQSLLSILLVVVTIGLIVGQIITPTSQLVQQVNLSPGSLWELVQLSPYLLGIVGVAATLLLLGLLVLVYWLIVWLVGKFPAFGNVELRLALRNLSTHRLRTATTLLALSAGMFVLSSITFVGEGTRELLNTQLANQFGGNVLAIPLPVVPDSVARLAINTALTGAEGISYRTLMTSYGANLTGIDGERIQIDDDDSLELQLAFWNNHAVIESDNPNLAVFNSIVQGRGLMPEDYGKRVIIGPLESAQELGISVGSILTYLVDGQFMDFEVVGLTDQGQQGSANFMGTVMPDGVIEGERNYQLFTFQVEPDQLNDVLLRLSNIPLIFSLDVGFIDSFLSRLIAQFSAIPTVVGLLSLLAAAVIMANTVALSTLERRRQIGILKSVGLKSKRILLIMLIETTIVGVLSAVIGLGLSSVFVTIYTNLLSTPIPLPQDSRLIAVLLVIAAILIGWIATFLSANVAVRERVMNVLRYE